ncbi:MAG TPA: hypothetical protein VFB58_02580 [Chloroflexota bacterium]|nr:hypothetical protein [Chloroflexota bacterium]
MNRRALLIVLVLVVAAVVVVYMMMGKTTGQAAAHKTTPTHHVNAVLHTEEVYAVQLLPVLDRSASDFSSVAARAGRTSNLGKLNNLCGSVIPELSVMESRADGVPHTFQWWTPAGHMHHHLFALYHDMLGAAVACQTDASNGDSADAGTAVHQMQGSAAKLRRMDSYLHYLANKLGKAERQRVKHRAQLTKKHRSKAKHS